MRLRIQHPLFAGFLGVTGVLVALLLVLVGSGLRRELVETFEAELDRQLALAQWIVEADGQADANSLVRAITDRIGYRVTFIDTVGVVLADSYVDPGRLPHVENHLGRPEVQGALAGGTGFASRTSVTVDQPLLYAARVVTFRNRPTVLRIAAPLTDVERAVDRVRRAVTLAGLLAAGFALLLAYLLSFALARPLVTLADRARSLARGDFSRRAPVGSRVGELEDLAVAFNRLTDELQARLGELGRERDEMEALIDCIAEGVVALTEDARVLRTNRAARQLLGLPTHVPPHTPVGALVRQPELRKLLERSVVAPVDTHEIQAGGRYLMASSRMLDQGGAVATFLDVSEIRRLERVRRDFVANASHELKTPLTSIRGFAETLLDGDPPEHLRRKFLGSIRNNALRLQRLVDDLLDLSRFEAGVWVSTREVVEVAPTAAEAWQSVAESAEERGIHFRIEGAARVAADPQGVVQIFRNLLENAVRHTDPGGHVGVELMEADEAGMVTVEVSDDGEGIPSAALPRIFERFYRADSSRARDQGGTGLGLSIVRHLVGAMGGQVEAKSELGAGTTIRFTLPAG